MHHLMVESLTVALIRNGTPYFGKMVMPGRFAKEGGDFANSGNLLSSSDDKLMAEDEKRLKSHWNSLINPIPTELVKKD
jgi:hypothetical protein